MTQRRKIILGSLLGAVAIHLAFLACGTPALTRDANSPDTGTLADVASDIADRETSTADAQGMPSTTLEARCVVPDGGVAGFAYFDVPSVRAHTVPRLRASVCGYPDTQGYFPGTPGADVCFMANGVAFMNGRVSVLCGPASTARLLVE